MWTEAQREELRAMARGTADKEGVMTDFDRDIVGPQRARIDIPLRDTVMLKKHLTEVASTVERCRAILAYGQKDERATLLGIRMLLRTMNKKINSYKKIRNF